MYIDGKRFCHGGNSILNIETLDKTRSLKEEWGCSSVVERALCMCEAPGSIPCTSISFEMRIKQLLGQIILVNIILANSQHVNLQMRVFLFATKNFL